MWSRGLVSKPWITRKAFQTHLLSVLQRVVEECCGAMSTHGVASQHAERGGLPCSVHPQETEAFSRGHREADTPHSAEGTRARQDLEHPLDEEESLLDVLDDKDGLVGLF